MARTSKLDGNKPSHESVEDLLSTILEDMFKAATMSFEDWRKLSALPFVSMAIPAGPGREYRVTQVGVNAAHRLTEQTWRKRKDFQQTIARAEFDKLSFRAIGTTFLDLKSRFRVADAQGNIPPDEAMISPLPADYGSNLDRLADSIRPEVDRHIPCQLFDLGQCVLPFSVGQVEFLPRAAWITRYVKEPIQFGHIGQVETGAMSYEAFRDLALAPESDHDLRTAWKVLSSLKNYGWVATIRIRGHELSQSHLKASTIVGLAIDAIGLRFQVEDARRFTRAGRQHLFSEDRLATSPEGIFLMGWSVQMPGLGSSPGALAAKMATERSFLDAAGVVLDAYVEGRQTGRAPHLVERWANALYWVGEARREASDFMAVVNYGCAADGLSGAGGNATAMTTFAEAALNPKAQPTPSGSFSITEAVTKVYREGRNKLAHGEMTGLFEDLSEARAVGDALLVNLFDAVTFELAEIITNRPAILTLNENHAYRALETRLRQRP